MTAPTSPMHTSGHILITGANGYTGRLLAKRYIDATDFRLTLQMRAADKEAARARRDELAALLGPRAAARVRYVHSDLVDPSPFGDVDVASITLIAHTAAVTRFNVEQPLARAVNVEGTRAVLALAARCPRLLGFGLLSTVYASGLRPGVIDEKPLDDRLGFANFYEWSKFEAERLALAAATSFPVKILRLSTVVADDENGQVTQYNAFHNTLKLYFHGLLSLLPGDRATPVYIVTARFVADAVYTLLGPRVSPGIFHITHDRAASPTLERLIDRVFDAFEAHEGFRRRRVLRPVYASQQAFEDLARGVESFGGDVVRQALRSMTPFARQLYVPKDITNDNTRAALEAYAPDDTDALIRRVASHLVATRWGRATPDSPDNAARQEVHS